VADAIVMAGTSACHGETFDVGCGVNYSVNELFEMICEVLGREMTPKYGLARAEPTQTLADVRKIHNVLGWKARVGLRKGLEKWI
jgi:nucleoside-diphosphate-sugar epimerase